MNADESGYLFAIAILVAYFLPMLIAGLRHHHNFLAIMWLNILTGWTLLGWLIAFIWSLTAVRREGRA